MAIIVSYRCSKLLHKASTWIKVGELFTLTYYALFIAGDKSQPQYWEHGIPEEAPRLRDMWYRVHVSDYSIMISSLP
jgi:hypothetical protein